jgi:hypothetical protein
MTQRQVVVPMSRAASPATNPTSSAPLPPVEESVGSEAFRVIDRMCEALTFQVRSCFIAGLFLRSMRQAPFGSFLRFNHGVVCSCRIHQTGIVGPVGRIRTETNHRRYPGDVRCNDNWFTERQHDFEKGRLRSRGISRPATVQNSELRGSSPGQEVLTSRKHLEPPRYLLHGG